MRHDNENPKEKNICYQIEIYIKCALNCTVGFLLLKTQNTTD